MKITDKQKCTNCVHRKVCGIYDFAKKIMGTSSIKFAPHTMSEVCMNYKRDLEIYYEVKRK